MPCSNFKKQTSKHLLNAIKSSFSMFEYIDQDQHQLQWQRFRKAYYWNKLRIGCVEQDHKLKQELDDFLRKSRKARANVGRAELFCVYWKKGFFLTLTVERIFEEFFCVGEIFLFLRQIVHLWLTPARDFARSLSDWPTYLLWRQKSFPQDFIKRWLLKKVSSCQWDLDESIYIIIMMTLWNCCIWYM
jgi:hypothetical protein